MRMRIRAKGERQRISILLRREMHSTNKCSACGELRTLFAGIKKAAGWKAGGMFFLAVLGRSGGQRQIRFGIAYCFEQFDP